MNMLDRLQKHFSDFCFARGRTASMDLDVKGLMRRKAADEGADKEKEKEPPKKPAMPPVKPPVNPEPKKKTIPDAAEAVADSIGNLDELVEKTIERKVELILKRVTEETIRQYLAKPFAQLEKGIRPTIEKEISDQSTDIRKEIHEAIPTDALSAEPAAEDMPKHASMHVETTLPQPLDLGDGVTLTADPSDATLYKVVIVADDGARKELPFAIPVVPGLADAEAKSYYQTALSDSADELLEKFKDPIEPTTLSKSGSIVWHR